MAEAGHKETVLHTAYVPINMPPQINASTLFVRPSIDADCSYLFGMFLTITNLLLDVEKA